MRQFLLQRASTLAAASGSIVECTTPLSTFQGVIASIFTNKTFERKGFRAAATSMFKTRVKLPAGPGAASRAPDGAGAAPAQPRGAADAAGRSWRWLRPAGRSGEAKGVKEGATSIWEEDEAGPVGNDDVSVSVSLRMPPAAAFPEGRACSQPSGDCDGSTGGGPSLMPAGGGGGDGAASAADGAAPV
jgi:hypothetical protein